MSLWNTIIVAFIALKRNPTRALLTTLGIMIGIAAVITMMEIGRGSSNSIRNSIEKMGANSVTIMPGWVRVGGISRGANTRVSLMPSDAEAIGRECGILLSSGLGKRKSGHLRFKQLGSQPHYRLCSGLYEDRQLADRRRTQLHRA